MSEAGVPIRLEVSIEPTMNPTFWQKDLIEVRVLVDLLKSIEIY